jgi:hypothetical protein
MNGVMQEPFHRVDMTYAFDNAEAADRHITQYFEIQCNRGIYHDGWTAVTKHALPWQGLGRSLDIDADEWELYDTNTDWTQSRDVAKQRPDQLARLRRLFDVEAARYNVLPLDPRPANASIPSWPADRRWSRAIPRFSTAACNASRRTPSSTSRTTGTPSPQTFRSPTGSEWRDHRPGR